MVTRTGTRVRYQFHMDIMSIFHMVRLLKSNKNQVYLPFIRISYIYCISINFSWILIQLIIGLSIKNTISCMTWDCDTQPIQIHTAKSTVYIFGAVPTVNILFSKTVGTSTKHYRILLPLIFLIIHTTYLG